MTSLCLDCARDAGQKLLRAAWAEQVHAHIEGEQAAEIARTFGKAAANGANYGLVHRRDG